MEYLFFDQDQRIMDLLSNHQSASVDTKCDRIVLMSQPKITFGGQQEILKLTLNIERVEIDTIYHPLAMVDQRPASGNCSLEKEKFCGLRRKDGKCTSDPINNEKCKFNNGHCDDEE